MTLAQFCFLFKQSATIWLAVLIAATRCAIVCSPGKMAAYCTLNNIRRAVGVITLVAFFYNLPRFFDIQVVEFKGTSNANKDNIFK